MSGSMWQGMETRVANPQAPFPDPTKTYSEKRSTFTISEAIQMINDLKKSSNMHIIRGLGADGSGAD